MSDAIDDGAKYDVAISFLAGDVELAGTISDLVEEGLSVFFFPRKQEELAGTNGLESMREPFSSARVVVVLYREPWGNTNWTRVEQLAITDRFLKEGWDWLLFVTLDETSVLPKWLPDTHVRFALEQYGIEQLAGAIKMRAQQRGGKINTSSALSYARGVHREAQRIEDEKAFFKDSQWILEKLHPEVEWIMKRLAEITAEISQVLGMTFTAHCSEMRCILRAQRVCLNVGWRQPYVNSALEETSIQVVEYDAPLFLPEERLMTWMTPKPIGQFRFKPTLSLTRDVFWYEEGSPKAAVPSEQLAQQIMKLNLNLIDRANKGLIDFSD